MQRRRHTPEQIVGKLREADRMLAERADVAPVCRSLEVSVQTYQPCWVQYKAMHPEDVARLKMLEKEIRSPKRLLAGKGLDNDLLPEVARGNF
jgi:putative transposase